MRLPAAGTGLWLAHAGQVAGRGARRWLAAAVRLSSRGYPSASGLRYFFHTVGPEVFEELCPLFTDTLRQARLLPEHSTFLGDPPERGVSISHDIMLHQARSACAAAR